MAQYNINTGTLPNDKTGDSLRVAMIKVQNNFTELYTTAPISNSVNVGNTTSNVTVNSTSVSIGNTGTKTIANSSSITTTSGYYTQVFNSGSGNLVIGTSNAASLVLYANNVTAAVVAANGNFGIGNNTPADLLTVGGTMRANQISVAGAFTINSTFVSTFVANNTNFVGSVSAANVVSNAQLSANLGNYQTTAGLSANVASLTANNTTFVGSVTAANVVSNAQLTANLANYQTTAGLLANVGSILTSYSSTINASSHTTGSGFGSVAGGFVANITAVAVGNSTSNVVITSNTIAGDITFSGNNIFSAANTALTGTLRIAAGAKILDSTGAQGQLGQVLTSNGSSNVYWTDPGSLASVNTAAAYNWTNNHTWAANNTINGSLRIGANAQFLDSTGSQGTVGQILASNGSSNVYWTDLPSVASVNTAATYNWTNTHTWFANLQINSTSLRWVGNTSTSPTITLANNGTLTIGNNSTTQTTSIISVANSSGNVQITPSGISGNGFSITTINATNISTGTLSDARLSSAVVNTSANFTLSGNTTFSANVEFTGTFNTSRANILSTTLSDVSGTISWDTTSGQIATVTLTGTGRTVAAPTNLKVGTYILHVVQDGTGSRTITAWNSIFKWPAGVAPVLTTTAGSRDVFSFVSDGTNLYGSYIPDAR